MTKQFFTFPKFNWLKLLAPEVIFQGKTQCSKYILDRICVHKPHRGGGGKSFQTVCLSEWNEHTTAAFNGTNIKHSVY